MYAIFPYEYKSCTLALSPTGVAKKGTKKHAAAVSTACRIPVFQKIVPRNVVEVLYTHGINYSVSSFTTGRSNSAKMVTGAAVNTALYIAEAIDSVSVWPLKPLKHWKKKLIPANAMFL